MTGRNILSYLSQGKFLNRDPPQRESFRDLERGFRDHLISNPGTVVQYMGQKLVGLLAAGIWLDLGAKPISILHGPLSKIPEDQVAKAQAQTSGTFDNM